MDVHTKEQRSFNMSKIKAKNTIPEIVVQKLLKDLRIPFSQNSLHLFGKPDFFLPNQNLIIETHGCFWHGHRKCKYFKLPTSNKEFWNEKIRSNRKRDMKKLKFFKSNQFKFLVIWECQIKNGNYFELILSAL